jgi:hypothetical protein|uniref:Uncharacterized protein n=1 Tax=Zea mays TaxID=4577 RepID=B8A354_MAIZE|nr:unknown [Zea mays]
MHSCRRRSIAGTQPYDRPGSAARARRGGTPGSRNRSWPAGICRRLNRTRRRRDGRADVRHATERGPGLRATAGAGTGTGGSGGSWNPHYGAGASATATLRRSRTRRKGSPTWCQNLW